MAERVSDTDGSFGTDRVTNRRRHWKKKTLPEKWNFRHAISNCRNLNKVNKNERTEFLNALWKESRGRDSTVDIEIRYELEGPWIESRWEIFRTSPDRPWGPPNHLYSGYRVSFPGVKRPGHGVTIHSHLGKGK